MAAADIAQALTQHDKVRRSTDIPLFYGRKDKDTISPHQLIERLARAARVANWNDDERVCDEFFLCLRDKAISWANTLDNVPGFDKGNWASVKAEFLAAYATKYTARTLCTSFHDLKQHNDETVQDFYNRVSEVFRDAFLVKPAHVTTFDGAAEERHGLTEVQAALIMKRGIDKMQLLVMNTMFQGGLKEEIRSKVLEKGPTLIQESVKLAREFEIISKDKSKSEKGNYIASVSPDDNNAEPDEVLEIEATELEHIKSINLIRKRQNKPPMRFKVRPGSKLPPSGQRPTCRYCKIEGHVQKVCRKRIAAGAPMVDGNNRPYASNGPPPSWAPQAGVATVQQSPWGPTYSAPPSAPPSSSPYYGLLPNGNSFLQ